MVQNKDEKYLVQPIKGGSYIRNDDGTLTQTSPEVCAPEPPDLELLKFQLQEQLNSPLQNLLPRFRSQQLYNELDPILHEAGTRLAKSREFVSEIESWEMLIECNARLAFGQVLTGMHRRYLIAVLNGLITGKSADQACLTNHKASKSKDLLRTESGWKSNPRYISPENIYWAVTHRMQGIWEGKNGSETLSPCLQTEAIAFVAEKIFWTEIKVKRNFAKFSKQAGVTKPIGRPKKTDQFQS